MSNKREMVRRYLEGEDVAFDIDLNIIDVYERGSTIDIEKVTQGLRMLFEGFGLRAKHIEIIPRDISAEDWRYLKKEIQNRIDWNECDHIALVMEYDHYLMCLERVGG